MSATVHVVLRRNWRRVNRAGDYALLPGETRVGDFADEKKARACARKAEAAARRKVNPFRCGLAWSDRCHLPEAVFRDALQDAGIEPPGPESGWAEWWEQAELSPALRSAVWGLLDRLRFYEATERPARHVAYAVVQIEWQYNDEWYYPPAEGGAAVMAYRSRERAEEECARRNAEAREEWRRRLRLPEPGSERYRRMDGHEVFPFDMESRLFPGQEPFDQRTPPKRRTGRPRDDDSPGKYGPDEVPFYEVVEVELPEGS